MSVLNFLKTSQKLKKKSFGKIELPRAENFLVLGSDKTLIPQFRTAHNYLRARSRIYYNWHRRPYAGLAHWLVLLFVIFTVSSMIFLAVMPAKAATKTWDGEGDDLLCSGAGAGNYWSCRFNWDLDTVPVAGDMVVFDSTSVKDCTIDDVGTWGTGATGENFSITADYSGDISQGSAGSQFTVVRFAQSGGTFNGIMDAVNTTITVTNNFDLAGTATFNSPAFLNIGGNFTQIGGHTTFTVGTSKTTTFNGSVQQTITTDGDAFYNLTLNNSGTDGTENDDIIFSGTNPVISGTLTITDGHLRLDTNNPSVQLSGSLSIGADGSVTPGNGLFRFAGDGIFTWADNTSGQDIGDVAIDGGAGALVLGTLTDVTASSTTVSGGDALDIAGDNLTLTGSATPLTLDGGLSVDDDSTIIYTGPGTVLSTDTGYPNLVINVSDTFQLSADLDVTGNLTLQTGTFDANSHNQQINSGNLVLSAGTVWTKGGTLTLFPYDTTSTFTDSNSTKQNLGTVEIGALIYPAGDKTVTLLSDMTVDALTVDSDFELDLGSSGGYVLTLSDSDIAVAGDKTVLTVNGTTTPGNSIVKYTATNAGGDVSVASSTYHSLELGGAETYVLAGDLTGSSALTGSTTIDIGATFDANGKNLTLAGDWSNSGTFTHSNSTITFNNSSTVSTISGSSTFYYLSCSTTGKTLSFESGSTQIVEGKWTIAGEAEVSNYVLLSRQGGSGTDQWKINPTLWSVDYVSVSNSNNLASNPIDPIIYVDGGNTTNWFPADGDDDGDGGGGGSKWCEKEQKEIPENDWTEERCAVEPATKWCEKEQKDIPEGEWTEERCIVPPPATKWCEKEQQYIPEGEWAEERCASSPPPGDKWCEKENQYIPEEEWTEERCASSPPPGSLKWCEKEQKDIPESDWTAEKCVPSLIPEIVEPIREITFKAVQAVRDVVEQPAVSQTVRAISTAGLIIGGAAIASGALFFPLSFAEWALLFLRLLGAIMTAFGLKKRVKPWGTVYDSVTKQPLDPAYVTLEDREGKEISSSITDLDGRYGFLTGPGEYKMSAQKTNYKFPSQKLQGRGSDELYNDLYFGEEIEVKESGEVIVKNIPLDREKFDWNEFAKKKKNLMKFYSQADLFFRRLSDWLFVVGFFAAIIAVIFLPYPYNYAILGLYLFLLLLRLFGVKPKTYGMVVEKETGFPLSFGVIRVFSVEPDREMFSRVIDQLGRYYILVPKSKYYLKVEKKNEDGSYSHIFTSGVINAQTGIIRERFRI